MESLDGVQIPIPLLWLVHQPSSRTWRDLNPPSRAHQWGQSKLALNRVCCGGPVDPGNGIYLGLGLYYGVLDLLQVLLGEDPRAAVPATS